jgi:DNA-binding transcriptional ArsR family regulator
VARSAAAAKLVARAPVFAALGDETRLGLVVRLSTQGPLSTVALTEGSKVTRQAVTKHLRVLSEAGLVKGTREGRDSIWELTPDRLDDVRRCLEAISGQWDAALGRLRDFVER